MTDTGPSQTPERRSRENPDDPRERTALDPILIVDDEKNIRRTLRMVLEGEGHVVHEAGSIAEASAVLERDPIDLILLDVKLGDDNGLDLLRTLKARG
jgi:CheY-like chemotaxis protein